MIANKPGFRYCHNGVIHLKADTQSDVDGDIVICFKRERDAYPIGSIFHMDYISHPTGKYYAVTEMYRPVADDEDEIKELPTEQISDDVFGVSLFVL